MNIHELSETVHRSEKTIKTNFPKFVASLAKKGIFVERDSKNLDTANYTITYGQPKEIDYTSISIRKYSHQLLEGEQWKSSYLGSDLEVSNLGRYRWTQEPNNFYIGSEGKDGYLSLTYNKKEYKVHRVVLQTFNPVSEDELSYLTVDHKNGKRQDNRLNNLEWVTNTENVLRMITQRGDLNKELTRIIQKIGYQNTLKLLQSL